MNTLSFQYSLHELSTAAERILQWIGDHRIILLQGSLAAGKTTLTTEICRRLGYNAEVSSPTYALINVYNGSSKIYHMDLYRLNDLDEAWDIGVEDYLYSGQYCIVEWPDIIIPMLDDIPYIDIKLEIADEGRRQLNAALVNSHS